MTMSLYDELKRRIWQIANDVRGTVDGWDFKQYVLGALFFRFISENFANYIEAVLKEDKTTSDLLKEIAGKIDITALQTSRSSLNEIFISLAGGNSNA